MYSFGFFLKDRTTCFQISLYEKSEMDMADTGMHYFSCNSNFIGTESLSPTATELQALHHQQQNQFAGF
jgi:hypothetical protein